MKNFYLPILLFLIGISAIAQGYDYGIVNTGSYNFKIVAIPDFSASTDASDMGFAISLPAGAEDIINVSSTLAGRTWQVQEFDAAFLTSQGLGDGSKDVFLFNNPPGQSLLAHSAGDFIDLVTFTVSNMPQSGEIAFLANDDAIATGSGGVLDSFYNANIDATTTQDYFMGYATGFENFMFSTLSISEFNLRDFTTKIYPNPSDDIIHITSDLDFDDAELFDITGKKVLEIQQPSKISLDTLPSGLYLLQLKNNSTTVMKRVVKK